MTPELFIGADFDDDVGASSGCCTWVGFRLASVAVPTGSVAASPLSYNAVSRDVASQTVEPTSGVGLPPSSFVGELDTDNANSLSRLMAKFTLPTAPDEAALEGLQNAELRLYVASVTGTPANGVSVYHSTSDNEPTSTATSYDDPSYLDTGLELIGPTSSTPGYYSVDVTDWVLADYRADRGEPRSAFRLQIDEAQFIEDGLSHGFQFGEANAYGPELILHFVPEPAASLLATIAFLAPFVRRRAN